MEEKLSIEQLGKISEKKYEGLKWVYSGFDSVNKLSDEIGIDHSNVMRRLERLEEDGWIKIVRPSRYESNEYKLTKTGRKILNFIKEHSL
ncbi:MAG: winged helix-turn-helix transcriptional regulator [Candidatus Nanohaloarchaea archaeon]